MTFTQPTREAGAVPGIVDPKPIIEERLRALAAEHQPRIVALEAAVRDETGVDVRAVKQELRAAKRSYATARRRVRSVGRKPMAW